MGPGHMGDNWGMWLLGIILMVLFWGGIIGLVLTAIRAIARTGNRDTEGRQTFSRQEDPLEILKGRYARGEMTREEYLSMRQDLEE